MANDTLATPQPVFPQSRIATHMPFLDGTTLVFCQSDSARKKSIKRIGSIWKTIRRNSALAERFRNLPKTQDVLYRAWKLAYCNWQDKIVYPVSTGLPEDVMERSPAFYHEGDRVHLSFISGIPTISGPNYRLYTCSGSGLEHMEPAKPLPHHPLFFGFVSPLHVCWGIQNILKLTEKASGKTFQLKVEYFRVVCATFLADDPSKLLITVINNLREPKTVLYDLQTTNISDVSVQGAIYKPSLHGDQLVFARIREDGFENRDLFQGDYALSPSTIKITQER